MANIDQGWKVMCCGLCPTTVPIGAGNLDTCKQCCNKTGNSQFFLTIPVHWVVIVWAVEHQVVKEGGDSLPSGEVQAVEHEVQVSVGDWNWLQVHIFDRSLMPRHFYFSFSTSFCISLCTSLALLPLYVCIHCLLLFDSFLLLTIFRRGRWRRRRNWSSAQYCGCKWGGCQSDRVGDEWK